MEIGSQMFSDWRNITKIFYSRFKMFIIIYRSLDGFLFPPVSNRRLIQSMVQHSSFNAWSCCGLEESIDKHQIICCRWPQDGNLSSWEGHPTPAPMPSPPGNGPLIRPYFFWDRGFRGGWYQTTSNFIKTFLYNNPKRTKSAQKFEIPDGRHIFWPKEWENSKMKIIGMACILSKQMEPSTTKVPIHTKMR